ncbi:DUF4445 domain-containing protein [bacterium]|nr:DUF4445 domain-containing protein [bacterium]
MRRKMRHAELRHGPAPMTEKISVSFAGRENCISVDQGTSVLDALLCVGLVPPTACGGQGTCGKCRVRIHGGISTPDSRERMHLTEAELARGVRLACRAVLIEDVIVDIPEHLFDLLQTSISHPKPGISVSRDLAVAVDIGTTSIKIAVIDLNEGQAIAHSASLNPQRVFGHDVMSRLQAACQRGLAREMTKLLRDGVIRLMSHTLLECRADVRDVVRIVISGNTVMLHSFFDMVVTGLATYPYTPHSLDSVVGRAKDYGLTALDRAELLGLPSISAFVGGDIVSGLIATGMHREQVNTIFLDIGTNSEIVLAHQGHLFATSCAAGPALEGMNIEFGMTATSGAITGVTIENDVRLALLAGTPQPLGLCGSGIIELMAELLRINILDTSGKMSVTGVPLPVEIRNRVQHVNGSSVFFLTEEMYFSQKDVRQVQLAKAAILSGVQMLQTLAGASLSDISKVIIAGEFGRHLKIAHLNRLGILEPYPRATYTFPGNSSLEGASLIAVNPQLLEVATKVSKQIEACSLSTHKGYEQLFIKSLDFPEGEKQRPDSAEQLSEKSIL